MTLVYKLRKAFRLQTYSHRSLPERWQVARHAAARCFHKASQSATYSDGWNNFKLAVVSRKSPRAWRELNERKRKLDLGYLVSQIDRAEVERIRTRYRDGVASHWTKYLDLEKWLKVNLRYAMRLHLLEQPPGAVLDLGCGGGYFLFVCRQLGCRTLGVDLDTDPLFNDIVHLLDVERIGWRVEPFVKLPDFQRKFDLITAFMITFNNFDTPAIWRPEAWGFLIDDLHTRLQAGGRILFSLNCQLDGRLYDDDLLALFRSRGAKINGKELLFSKEDLDAAQRGRAGRTVATIRTVSAKAGGNLD